MIGILIISHGQLASGIKDTMELIAGKQEKLETLTLAEGQNLEAFSQAILDAADRLSDCSDLLIFVDMFGATPFNKVSELHSQLAEKFDHVGMLTGTNLPMLLEASLSRHSMEYEELYEKLVSVGQEGIESLSIK